MAIFPFFTSQNDKTILPTPAVITVAQNDVTLTIPTNASATTIAVSVVDPVVTASISPTNVVIRIVDPLATGPSGAIRTPDEAVITLTATSTSLDHSVTLTPDATSIVLSAEDTAGGFGASTITPDPAVITFITDPAVSFVDNSCPYFLYDNNVIQPAPLVTIVKNYNRLSDNTPISATYDITLRGTLLPDKGSPTIGGSYGFNIQETSLPLSYTDNDFFNALLRKQEHIRELFSNDGRELSWRPAGSYNPVICYPEVVGITFNEDQWVQRTDYEIRLKAASLTDGTSSFPEDDFGEFEGYNLTAANESFNITEAVDGTNIYKFSRTISATSIRVQEYNQTDEPWELAKQWVDSRLSDSYGFTSALTSAIENTRQGQDFDLSGLNSYTPYSRARVETVDEINGSYSITEEWTLSVDPAIDTYTIRHQTTRPRIKNTDGSAAPFGVTNTYTVSGTVTGLESNSLSRWENALEYYQTKVLNPGDNKFDLLIDKIASALDVDTSVLTARGVRSPNTSVVTRNTLQGVIQYEIGFEDNDAAASEIFAAISVSVAENLNEQVIATIPVPGRLNGPIVQNINTKPINTRTLNATYSLRPKDTTSGLWDYSDIDQVRLEAVGLLGSSGRHKVVPTGTQNQDWWVTTWSDTFDYQQGTYNLNAVFTFKGTSASRPFEDPITGTMPDNS